MPEQLPAAACWVSPGGHSIRLRLTFSHRFHWPELGLKDKSLPGAPCMGGEDSDGSHTLHSKGTEGVTVTVTVAMAVTVNRLSHRHSQSQAGHMEL